MKSPPVFVILTFAVLMVTVVITACNSAAGAYPSPSFIASQDCEDLRHGVLPVTDLTLTTSQNDITVQVEIADEATERSQGLMCRDSIPSGTGMLFTYDTDRSSGFWMFNTYAPIDILYLDQSGRVVDKITMSPCPRNSDADEEWKSRCAADAAIYVPLTPWRYSLELPADWLADQGMGDPIFLEMKVSWPALGN